MLFVARPQVFKPRQISPNDVFPFDRDFGEVLGSISMAICILAHVVQVFFGEAQFSFVGYYICGEEVGARSLPL